MPAGPVVGETSFFSKANAKPLFYAAIAVFGAILYGEQFLFPGLPTIVRTVWLTQIHNCRL